jgi:lipoate-protein ligase A
VAGPRSDLTPGRVRPDPAVRLEPGPVRWLGFAAASPARNMAVDRALLSAACSPAIRLYAWSPPGVSLGWFQRRVDLAPFERAGYEIVRRVTGGGAVVHHHEVTYAVLLPTAHPRLAGLSVVDTYGVIHAPVREALRALGVETSDRPGPARDPRDGEPDLCFERASPFDILAHGKKIVGSAQRRLPDRVLQHGSIILAPNPLQPSQPTLSALAGRPVTPEGVAAALAAAFERAFGPLVPSSLTPAEDACAAGAAPARAEPA